MVAFGRALTAKPKLLFLDEPSLGLPRLVVEAIFDIVAKLAESGLSILLVEQNANLALEISNYGYVLETGRIGLHDESSALRRNPQVQSAYLGG